MCQKVYALFRCADFHDRPGQVRDRFKLIRDCAIFRDGSSLSGCGEWRRVHDPKEDDPDEYCPECRGKRPPEFETPSRGRRAEATARPDDQLGYQLCGDARENALRNTCDGCWSPSGWGGFHKNAQEASHAGTFNYDVMEGEAAGGCNFAQVVIKGWKKIGVTKTSALDLDFEDQWRGVRSIDVEIDGLWAEHEFFSPLGKFGSLTPLKLPGSHAPSSDI